MSPLDFSRPVFLTLYVAFGAWVCFRLNQLNRSREPQAPIGAVPTDPLAIAFLRDGAPELLRVAAVTLLERGALILAPGDELYASKKIALPPGAPPLERALRDHFTTGGEARSIFSDERLLSAARAHAERQLERAGLIPDTAARQARQDRCVRAILALAAPAALKIAVALSRGHPNVLLLAAAAAAFGFFAYRMTQRPRTPAGDRALEYLMLTFEPVRSRIMRQRDWSIDDLAVTAGVFGIAALPAASYAHTNALRPVDAETQRTFRIDDHRHEVTSDVYELLTIVSERARHPLTIVLERDGAFPTFTELLADLRRARHALEAGRRAAQRAFA